MQNRLSPLQSLLNVSSEGDESVKNARPSAPSGVAGESGDTVDNGVEKTKGELGHRVEDVGHQQSGGSAVDLANAEAPVARLEPLDVVSGLEPLRLAVELVVPEEVKIESSARLTAQSQLTTHQRDRRTCPSKLWPHPFANPGAGAG